MGKAKMFKGRIFEGSRLCEMVDEIPEEVIVQQADVLDTEIGPVVVSSVDEEEGTCTLVNTEDQTLEVSAEELAELDPVKIELEPEEVYAITDEGNTSEEPEEN